MITAFPFTQRNTASVRRLYQKTIETYLNLIKPDKKALTNINGLKVLAGTRAI
jgi:hypothetical protein